MNPFPLFRRLLTPSFRDRPDFLDSFSTAGCGGIDPCTPGICERLSTPSDESYARIMLRRSITLKTAVGSRVNKDSRSASAGAPTALALSHLALELSLCVSPTSPWRRQPHRLRLGAGSGAKEL